MTTLYDELRELQERVQSLQRALCFWLPSVPMEGPEPICKRIGDDAHLLIGYEGPEEKDAETLGWIRLTHAVTASSGE